MTASSFGAKDDLDERTKSSAAQTREKIRDIFSGRPRIPASLKQDAETVALARAISERNDFNLRTGDFWADSAKAMAKAILQAVDAPDTAGR